MASKLELVRYLAERQYAQDDLVTFDGDAEVQPVGDSYWVQAWVFVSSLDIEVAQADQESLPPVLRD